MLGTSGACALKRRRKPVQKNAKLQQMKTNPSKRHRDRLNVELDHLTGLLPFPKEVTAHLDKLSVLRLSVGYLKVKSYVDAALPNNASSAPPGSANNRNGPSVSLDGASFSEGELLLQALNGFVLVVTADGTIFYASQTIQAFLGYHQSDVVHQSVYELLHMDDRHMFRCQLHFALNPNESSSDRADDAQPSDKAFNSTQSSLPQYIPPENSSFLERSFCCRLRCLLDNPSGFLALNIKGRLKYLLQEHARDDEKAAPPQLALFAIATPVQPPSVMEIRTKTLLFQTKHRLDFAPLGIDSRGKLVLGYTEAELLTSGSGYQFLHAADMMYCADSHLRTIKTGESGLAFFRLLTKTRQWLWVQAFARVIFKDGRPDFIIVRQKVLTNEEGEEHLRQRKEQLPFNLATGEGVLYDFSIPGLPGSGVPVSGEPTTEKPLRPASLLGSLLQQDRSVYTQPQEPSPQFQIFSQIEDLDFEQPQSSLEQASLHSHALLGVPGHIQTLQKRTTRGDLTSETMIDSLEHILGDVTDGGLEGLEVEETELRDWEKALVRMNKERKYKSRELNQILANDVFLYVEEALGRELGGYIQGSDQTGPHVPEKIYSLFFQGPHPEPSKNEWQPLLDMTSNRSGFAEQIQLGNILSNVGTLAELKGVSDRRAHTRTATQCHNTQQGHMSSSCPLSSSTHQCGNQMVSTQSSVTTHSWLPSVQIPSSMHSSHRSVLEATDPDSQQTYTGLQLQRPSVWQQQPQLLRKFHRDSLTLPTHTAGGVNCTAQSFYPQIQPLPGSCMYEEREGHMLNAATVPNMQVDPLLGPACSTGTTHVTGNAPHITLSHPGVEVACINRGVMLLSGPNAHMAACADVGNINLGHLSGDSTGLGTAPSDRGPENGSLQSSSFFCWNSGAQIPL